MAHLGFQPFMTIIELSNVTRLPISFWHNAQQRGCLPIVYAHFWQEKPRNYIHLERLLLDQPEMVSIFAVLAMSAMKTRQIIEYPRNLNGKHRQRPALAKHFDDEFADMIEEYETILKEKTR